MPWWLACGLALASAPASDPAPIEGLGLTPLKAPLHIGGTVSPDGCGWCHEAQFEEWTGSRHQTAWTNEVFQAGFAAEPQRFCVFCHAPEQAQFAEVIANIDWYRSRHPEAPGPAVTRKEEPRAGLGVHCGVCHVRDGVVLTANDIEGAPHETRRSTELSSSELCITCHEFPIPAFLGGDMHLTDVLMQRTGTEWRAWQQQGGDRSCQDCHMPEGRHVFRGAHDTAWLRASVAVESGRDEAGPFVDVKTVGVGHRLPTGDLFRRITVRSADHEIAAFYREFDAVFDEDLEAVTTVEVSDTTLIPGKTERVYLPVDATAWSVVYHYGSERDERRGLLDLATLREVLHEGSVTPVRGHSP